MKDRNPICLSSRLRADWFLVRRGHLRGVFVLATVVGAGLGVGAPCRADLVIEAPNLTVAPGSSGSFDVLITSTGGTFSVAADDIELDLSGLSSVSFTGISINTVTPYIYGTNSASLYGSTFIFNVSSNDVEAFDYYFSTSPTAAQAINPGDVFGLLNVQYSVASNAVAGTSGTLSIGPDTSLSDANGSTVLFTLKADRSRSPVRPYRSRRAYSCWQSV